MQNNKSEGRPRRFVAKDRSLAEDAGRSGAISPLFGVLVCQWQSDQSVAEGDIQYASAATLITGALSLGTVCRS